MVNATYMVDVNQLGFKIHFFFLSLVSHNFWKKHFKKIKKKKFMLYCICFKIKKKKIYLKNIYVSIKLLFKKTRPQLKILL